MMTIILSIAIFFGMIQALSDGGHIDSIKNYKYGLLSWLLGENDCE